MTLPPKHDTPADRVLELSGICKRFGAVQANDAITLELHRGEVLALLGDNGAGKSTLMAILFGQCTADRGYIRVCGEPLAPGDTAAALAAGIGMVPQHCTLAGELSVLDNLMLGTEPLWWPFTRRRPARERLHELGRRFGLTVGPEARVATLPAGARQRVAILKALYRGARILVLDEPTAALTPDEAQALFRMLATLTARGLSVILVTHRLDEALSHSDRVAVLRRGRLVAERRTAHCTRDALAALMAGTAAVEPRVACDAAATDDATARATRQAAAPALPTTAPPLIRHGGARLQLRALSLGQLRDATLDVAAGEIVGIAGAAGNGQDDLARALFGLARPASGALLLDGAPLPASPRALIRLGVARVPADRADEALIGELSVADNAVAERLRDAPISRLGWIAPDAVRAIATRLLRDFELRCADPDAPAHSLAPGDMQKLVLGRELAAGPAPRVLVLHQPTQGLDAGARAAVHAQLHAARDAGAAVLLISDDIDELLALCDRIAVLSRGRLGPAHADATRDDLGLEMSGEAG